jgi:copper chaperone CopZ
VAFFLRSANNQLLCEKMKIFFCLITVNSQSDVKYLVSSNQIILMKTVIRSLLQAVLLIAVLSMALSFMAQPSSEKLSISTSAVCEMCKDRIEAAVKGLKGVEAALLNLDNKKLKVKYQPEAVSAEQIRESVRKAGYAADGLQPEKTAYEALPKCCQKSGVCADSH